MFDALALLTARAQIVHPVLAQIHDYWVDRCAGRWAPARADLDPAEMGRLLPYVALVEPVEGGRDYRLRLIGGHILQGYRLSPAPKLLSDLPEGLARATMERQYARLLAERHSMHYGPAASVMPGREHMVTEHIDMPLSRTGREVDLILAGVVILGAADWAAQTGAPIRPL
jgi:hypothetical protein